MIRRNRIVSFILVLVLCMGMALQVNATEIEETKKKAEGLEAQKTQAEQEKNALVEQLNALVSEMEETKARIEAKEEEITKKEEELIQARVDESSQYDSMKKRIRYMYENGNSQFIEILVESQNIADFLNKAEYISTISEYDRDMLVEFQKIVQDVEAQEAALKAEYEELEVMQDDLIAKQESLEAMMASKSDEISNLEAQIGETAQKLSGLQAAAAEAARKQQEAVSSYSSNAGEAVVSGNGMFTHPCPGYTYVSSQFGYREQPIAGASTNHKGLDLAASTGTPIYAAADGRVIQASYSGNAGNMVIIDHGNGLQTYYMHCNVMYVSSGQSVTKGQNIAAVGTTGNSSGPHLHFQVMSDGTPVNPNNYL